MSRKVTHQKLGQTITRLKRGPVTAHAMALNIGVCLMTAQTWMRELHHQRIVYICAWEHDTLGRDATPVYSLGSYSDVPRRKQTRAEISRRWRQRQKEAA